MSKKVKIIISNIPILDNNGKQEYDDLGFARFMDSEEVASTLFYELSNSRSCEHFWKKFNNLPNKKPWTKIIVDTINKENNYEIKSQFYQNFRKESILKFLKRISDMGISNALYTQISLYRTHFYVINRVFYRRF